jgi:hypothetical protein
MLAGVAGVAGVAPKGHFSPSSIFLFSLLFLIFLRVPREGK